MGGCSSTFPPFHYSLLTYLNINGDDDGGPPLRKVLLEPGEEGGREGG